MHFRSRSSKRRPGQRNLAFGTNNVQLPNEITRRFLRKNEKTHAKTYFAQESLAPPRKTISQRVRRPGIRSFCPLRSTLIKPMENVCLLGSFHSFDRKSWNSVEFVIFYRNSGILRKNWNSVEITIFTKRGVECGKRPKLLPFVLINAVPTWILITFSPKGPKIPKLSSF